MVTGNDFPVNRNTRQQLTAYSDEQLDAIVQRAHQRGRAEALHQYATRTAAQRPVQRPTPQPVRVVYVERPRRRTSRRTVAVVGGVALVGCSGLAGAAY